MAFDLASLRSQSRRAPRGLLSMGLYLGSGVLLGLAFVLALAVTRETPAAAAVQAPVTDDVVRLRAGSFAGACAGVAPGRVELALEVGLDGKVRFVRAQSVGARSVGVQSDAASLARCVEGHVAAWEFLPQAQAATMTLAVDVAR